MLKSPIEKIIYKKYENNITYYLIKFKNFNDNYNTWCSLNELITQKAFISINNYINIQKEKNIPLNEDENFYNDFIYDFPNKMNNKEYESEYGELPNDEPESILLIKKDSNFEKYVKIEWKKRKNEIKPKDSFINIKIFNLFYPNMLLDYLVGFINSVNE